MTALTSQYSLSNVGMEGTKCTPALFQVFVVSYRKTRVNSRLDTGQEGLRKGRGEGHAPQHLLYEVHCHTKLNDIELAIFIHI